MYVDGFARLDQVCRGLITVNTFSCYNELIEHTARSFTIIFLLKLCYQTPGVGGPK